MSITFRISLLSELLEIDIHVEGISSVTLLMIGTVVQPTRREKKFNTINIYQILDLLPTFKNIVEIIRPTLMN